MTRRTRSKPTHLVRRAHPMDDGPRNNAAGAERQLAKLVAMAVLADRRATPTGEAR